MGKCNKKKKSLNEGTHYAGRIRMRTSLDVIHRCQHDINIDENQVLIGYWDRILSKIIEKPLKAFSSWGHIENAARDELAIPLHRIEYIKYRAKLIWDRATKLDVVFGSTPPFTKLSFTLEDNDCSIVSPQESHYTPLQELAYAQGIENFDQLKCLLTGPGFGCKVKTATIGNTGCRIFSVMYDDQKYFVKQTHDMSLEARALDHCRGCIYEQSFPFRLVCAAFDKFWQVEDHRAADIHFEDQDLTVTEKCDGLLTKMYYYQGEWRIASNSMPCAFSAIFRWGDVDEAIEEKEENTTSVGSLFMDAVQASVDGGWKALCEALRTDRCYAFELLHPRARIVVPHVAPRLVHLLTRQLPDGLQIEDVEIAQLVPHARILPRSIYARVHGSTKQTLLNIARRLPAYIEGFVAQDSSGRRVKIKGTMYLMAHHSRERSEQRGFFAASSLIEIPLSCWQHRILLQEILLQDQALVKQLLPKIVNRLMDENNATEVEVMESISTNVEGPFRLQLEKFLHSEIMSCYSAGPIRTMSSAIEDNTSIAHQKTKPNERLDPRRPNYFVCIKIDNPAILNHVRVLQQALVDFDSELKASLQPIYSLHITLATAYVNSRQQLTKLKEVLARIVPNLLATYLSIGAITIEGVNSFRVRGQVVFIEPVEQGRLIALMDCIYNVIESIGILAAGRRAQNRPHITVAKLPRALVRSIGFFDESAWRCRGFGPKSNFGIQYVNTLELCEVGLNGGTAPSGFYRTQLSLVGIRPRTVRVSFADATERIVELANSMMSLMLICRGCPGSGKTFFAQQVKQRIQQFATCQVCSADYYFERRGQFDATNLAHAHAECKNSVRTALLSKTRIVIIDNTNCTLNEVATYLDLAASLNSCIHIAFVEFECDSLAQARRFALRSVHKAPADSAWRRWDVIPIQKEWTYLVVNTQMEHNLEESLNNLAAARRLRYCGIFLTEASKQKLVQVYPPLHPVVKAQHVTIAFRPEVGSIQLRAVAAHFGQNVKLQISNPVSNANSQVVHCIEQSLKWQGHITISYAIGSRAADSRYLTFEDIPMNNDIELDGIVGVHTGTEELISANAVVQTAQALGSKKRATLSQKCPIVVNELVADSNWTQSNKLYIWDFDKTLVETAECSSRKISSKLPSPDDPKSLDYPSTPLPALALLHERSMSLESSSHVLITGRISRCKEAVIKIIKRYRALEALDACVFKPNAWNSKSSHYKACALEQILNTMPNVKEVVVYDDDVNARNAYINLRSGFLSMGRSLSIEAHDPHQLNVSQPPLRKWLACFGLGDRPQSLSDQGLEAFNLLKVYIQDKAECKIVGSWARGRCSDVDVLCFGPEDAISFLERLESQLSADRNISATYIGRSPRRSVLSFQMKSGLEIDVSVADAYDTKENSKNCDDVTLCALDALSIALAARGIVGAPWLHSLRTHELFKALDLFKLNSEIADSISPAALAASFAAAVADKKNTSTWKAR
uniref:Uncharacterized protein n=2 Tax=Aureoumbra lagunensis TaxID=44058 RepID=A0A7S3NIG7_9STRA